VGKTRLSIQAGELIQENFPDGVWFIPLSAVENPGHFLPTLASYLGVPEAGGGALIGRVITALRGRKALLILDNFEHLITAGSQLTEILVNCPPVKAMITSRIRLDVYGEHEYTVRPFTMPPTERRLSPTELMEYDAVRLFVLRVQAYQPDFALNDDNSAAVAEIVARLDGLPLAIELAAARLREFSLHQLAGQLAQPGRRLPALSGGPRDLPARQQTLMGAIAWSYDLLDPQARILFNQLAVFNGGSSQEAALAVCEGASIAGIRQLIEHNLLWEEPTFEGERRLKMLETLKEFAMHRLIESGQAPTVRKRHLEYFLNLVREAEPRLRSSDDRLTLRMLDEEVDNLRLALSWGLEHLPEQALRLAGWLWLYWFKLSYWSEGRAWVEAVLSKTPSAPDSVRLPALIAAASFAYFQGDISRAEEVTQQSLDLAQVLKDVRSQFLSMHHLALIQDERGNAAEAVRTLEQAIILARQSGDSWLVSLAYSDLGNIYLRQSSLDQAKAAFEESLKHAQYQGDPWVSLYGQLNLSEVAYLQGDFERAAYLGEMVLGEAREYGDRQVVAGAVERLALVASKRGHLDLAVEYLVQAIDLTRGLGQKQEIPRLLEELAECLLNTQPKRAASLAAAAASIRSESAEFSWEDYTQASERFTNALRHRLGETEFRTAWIEGQKMTFEQALEATTA
jgi:predicted ATPase